MDIVEALHPQERVACLGDQPLRLRAYVSGEAATVPCVAEPNTACIDGPAWLTGFGGWTAGADSSVDTPSIGGPPLAIDPGGAVPSSALSAGAMVDLEGAFDHPAARDCRPGAAGPDAPPLTAAAARLECRARFVVTGVRSDPDYPASNAAGITVTDDLRVRSEPGLTGERYELLPTGTRVWVIDGPVVASDYEWFQVVAPSIDVGDGVPRVGWVAASEHGAEPWLQRATVDCPDGASVDVDDVMRLTSPGSRHEGLACFGSSTIRFAGTLELVCGLADRAGWVMTPAWLSSDSSARLRIRDGDAVVDARPRPGLGLPVACGGTDAQRYIVEAHFDDEAAAECDATISASEEPRDLEWAAPYWCRTTLVVESLAPAP
jgi:hypothetical protein